MPSTSRSLVLGFAARLSPDLLAPFVTSLRATGFRGRIGFVLAHYDRDAMAEVSAMADLSLDVSSQYGQVSNAVAVRLLRGLRTTRGLRRTYPTAFTLATLAGPERNALQRWRAREYELEGLQSLRYGHYEQVLRDLAPDADQIMLTDLRDVVFQADPFDAPLDGLEVFLEDASCLVGTDPFNSRWIRNLYGPDRLAQLSQETVSCSGTVFGTRDATLNYLREMTGAIQGRRRPLGSHDQGVHNHLLRSGRLGAVTIVPNETGRVLTMGTMTNVRRRADGRVLNVDGTLPPVLHQYDRHPGQVASLFSSLGIC